MYTFYHLKPWTSGWLLSTHPECSIVLLLLERENKSVGCAMEWDGVSCWPAASVGESTFPVFFLFTVLITRNCTMQGWSKPSLPYYIACYYEDYVEEEQSYFDTLMLIYSVGYGASLAALFIAILVFCCFRKLLCTRTYIHINLFSTFILRSLAVFIKDAVLFADKNVDHCTVSTCKAAVTFFQYCVLANFFWLLVESLYLQTLLVFTFTHKRTLFWVYAVIGWGKLCVYIPLSCWDNLDSGLWWIIKTPILLSIFVRHVIFTPFPYLYRISLSFVRAPLLLPAALCRRLLRSTLLLVPLFGLHYVVFALFPDSVGTGPRLYLELLLGSFQVPDLSTAYPSSNRSVQNEIRRAMRGCWPEIKTSAIDLQTQECVP
uniref:Growth hormone releasing hormone receptor 2 n=1 Tax=Myripristis murdjan TaxID=586833 RepID=A0A668ASD1_9TELE